MKTKIIIEVIVESQEGTHEEHSMIVHELIQSWGDDTGGIITDASIIATEPQ